MPTTQSSVESSCPGGEEELKTNKVAQTSDLGPADLSSSLSDNVRTVGHFLFYDGQISQ